MQSGVADLEAGQESAEALLCRLALRDCDLWASSCPRRSPLPSTSSIDALAPRRAMPLTPPITPCFASLSASSERPPHARVADATRIEQFMRELGRAVRVEGRVYLTGGDGSSGWRDTTIDVDIKLIPDHDEILREIPRTQGELEPQRRAGGAIRFHPPTRGLGGSKSLIRREGQLSFHHFDPAAQALSKAERGHAQDVRDIEAMIATGLVNPAEVLIQFKAIEPELFRFPAIDPASFRKAIEDLFAQ